MTVVVLSADLLTASRLLSLAEAAGLPALRIDDAAQLQAPASGDLVLVDWGERQASWPQLLGRWRARAPSASRLILFGPHTDLEAHREAKAAGLGPMMARSRLFSSLPDLLSHWPPA